MKLYIKQKVFSWGDKFRIYDENENDVYLVEGEVFTLGKKLHLYSPDKTELAFIHQKVFSFLPRFFISVGGNDVAEVKKEFTFFKHKFTVDALGWEVHGDFFSHSYEIASGNRTIASISKRWFSWGDTYEIYIANKNDVIMALCVVLVIDAVLSQANAAAASQSANN